MICLFASDHVLDGNVTSSPHVANRDSHKTGKGVRDATIPKRYRRKITAEVWCRARHAHSLSRFAGKASSPGCCPTIVGVPYVRLRPSLRGAYCSACAQRIVPRPLVVTTHHRPRLWCTQHRREGAEKAARRVGEVFRCGEPGTASRHARLPTDH
ncbi:hypothetical protein CSOJ01_05166 [Colletotrichum sojae]|uniref:Uncharacterized protein n=1 Tax=Colletotrichum sojae TaxID=2175907 RepID=A0A8H6MY30_9PEZI|nr:hypothetical protein CSOJ01_05166 [Colletotrichum sojae]